MNKKKKTIWGVSLARHSFFVSLPSLFFSSSIPFIFLFVFILFMSWLSSIHFVYNRESLNLISHSKCRIVYICLLYRQQNTNIYFNLTNMTRSKRREEENKSGDATTCLLSLVFLRNQTGILKGPSSPTYFSSPPISFFSTSSCITIVIQKYLFTMVS